MQSVCQPDIDIETDRCTFNPDPNWETTLLQRWKEEGELDKVTIRTSGLFVCSLTGQIAQFGICGAG